VWQAVEEQFFLQPRVNMAIQQNTVITATIVLFIMSVFFVKVSKTNCFGLKNMSARTAK
jgi:hypothetical protein